MRHCAQFCRSVKPLPRYCDFSTYKMTAVRHLGFSKVCNFMADRVERVKCVIMPNYVAIGQSVVEIWLFFNFAR